MKSPSFKTGTFCRGFTWAKAPLRCWPAESPPWWVVGGGRKTPSPTCSPLLSPPTSNSDFVASLHPWLLSSVGKADGGHCGSCSARGYKRDLATLCQVPVGMTSPQIKQSSRNSKDLSLPSPHRYPTHHLSFFLFLFLFFFFLAF